MAEPDYASKYILERALENVGDQEKLADLLGIQTADLGHWILGREIPPHDVFLRALDLAFKKASPAQPALRQQAQRKRP